MKEIFLLPNLLTLSRILLILPSIYFIEKVDLILSVVFIGFLLITDFLDGFLARKLNQTSSLGAVLDPIADKLVVIAFFLHLLFRNSVLEFYVYLVLTRDLLQLSVIPVLSWWKKIPFKVKPKLIPKIGTALNFILIGLYEFQFIFSKLPELLQVYIDKIEMINYVILGLLLISIPIEVYILITFIPRFIQIYKGTHDTFE
ncbi:MAG TPA: CDP-alcohol phosphatidyltransferase family protein [Leptospiraceae bacterium]|nr:CDP-alcohol phosphatidyltransferase family protein [Leptospiraceae bacterium]HMW07638.1 CDP-alcohol phosphatidyltransferase family protein [Leptospiraceae bacterium]HMX32984.1 CDP-alcohol phosphatidyltransferase family protein [Leptospiraceae bacterium]HMY33243.1 CDP-alcohol phosphatidyltransferase family protein [Leptospiraceae bacterium]HMZ65749.1 CDP-alcohol phosphatidyltransferase family protein [Leptospiraceae bacterium]